MDRILIAHVEEEEAFSEDGNERKPPSGMTPCGCCKNRLF
jgi:hypothetical protein